MLHKKKGGGGATELGWPNFIVESIERHCIAYGCVCRGRSSAVFVSQVNPRCHRTECIFLRKVSVSMLSMLAIANTSVLAPGVS